MDSWECLEHRDKRQRRVKPRRMPPPVQADQCRHRVYAESMLVGVADQALRVYMNKYICGLKTPNSPGRNRTMMYIQSIWVGDLVPFNILFILTERFPIDRHMHGEDILYDLVCAKLLLDRLFGFYLVSGGPPLYYNYAECVKLFQMFRGDYSGLCSYIEGVMSCTLPNFILPDSILRVRSPIKSNRRP